MSEIYPEEQELLAITEDEHTGVEYIPTGKTPYYLEFRKLLHRLTLAAARSGDLRPFADGAATIGVKSGRAVINGQNINFAGAEDVALTNNALNRVYLDETGALQITTGDFPGDRSVYLPLAEVTLDAGVITSLTDLRGEAFLQSLPPRDGIWMQATYDGDINTSQAEAVFAAVPVNGRIDAVILTVGRNINSDDPADGVKAVVSAGGVNICTTDAEINQAAGAGSVSTAAGKGTAAVLDPAVAQVQAGDVLSAELILNANGNVSEYPADVILSLHILPT